MLRVDFLRLVNKIGSKVTPYQGRCLFSDKRRRKGDGSKSTIFEETSASDQEAYFRKKTARQIKELKERLAKMEKEQLQHNTEPDKKSNNKNNKKD